MGEQKALILIVHGAWHTPAHFEPLVAKFEDAGYQAVCPHLPSCNDAVPPNRTLADDVDLIRRTVEQAKAEKREVVVVCHSYGGIVATQALDGLRVKRLIYMSAFIPLKGEGLAGIFGGKLPPWIYAKNDGTLGLHNPDVHFFNDVCSPQTWAGRLVTHPASAQLDPVSCEAWRTIPTTYVVCEHDQALPPALQMMMVGRARQEGVDMNVETCAAGHSPFLSMPHTVVEIVSRTLR